MEQEDFAIPQSESEEIVTNIEDIDELATKPSSKVKSYQDDFIEKKLSQSRIAESQESTRGKLAIAIIGIYGSTILLCFAVIGFGLAKTERKEILTLIITSQATLIGSAIGFYFGKNQ